LSANLLGDSEVYEEFSVSGDADTSPEGFQDVATILELFGIDHNIIGIGKAK